MIMERRLPLVLSVISFFAFSLVFASVALAQTSSSCVRNAPLLEYVSPSSGSFPEKANSESGSITVSHTYKIKVTNKDSAGCGGSTFQFNFGTPPLYVTLDGKNQPFFASIKTIPAGQFAEVTGNTGNVVLNLVKSPQTFEIPVVVSRLLEAKTPSLDSTTVKSKTEGSYTMAVGFDKPSYAGGQTAAYFGTLKKNGVVFSGKTISVQIFKTKSGIESIESQTSLTTGSDGSFSGKITVDSLASKYRLIARYTDSSSPTSPVTVTVINSFCGSSDCSKAFGSVPAATNENPSGTIKLKVVVTREQICLDTKGYEPAITIRSQTGTRDIVSGQELTFDVTVLNREVACPDERFGSPLVGIADRTDPLRPIETEDTRAKLWGVKIDGNSPSRLPISSSPLPSVGSKPNFFIWQDFGIKDYTLKSYASASHRLTLKAPLAPEEVGNTRNFAFCISSTSQICQTVLVKVLPSGTGDKTPPSIISFSTNPSPAVVSKPVTFVAKVSDNAAIDKVVFSVDKNKNGGFDTSEIQTKTLSPKITGGDVSADSPVTFDNIGTYKYKIDVFDTSNNPSSSEGTITVGDGTTPPPASTSPPGGGTATNTGSGGDKIELNLDKDSYKIGDVVTITGTMTLKSESVVSPYVYIEFFDAEGKSIAKFSRLVGSSGSFGLKTVVGTSVKPGQQVKVVASYISAVETTKTLVSVEKLISVGGTVTPGTGTGTTPSTGTNAAGDKIEISTDKDSYKPGDILTVTGTLNLKSGTISTDTYVTIEFYDSAGTLLANPSRLVDSAGTFGYKTVFAQDVKLGKWKITAKYTTLSIDKNIDVVASTPAPQTVPGTGTQPASGTNSDGDELKIMFDKDSYKRGELATLSGTLILKSGDVKTASVEIEFKRPDGTIVGKFTKTPDSSGSFSLALNVAPEAPFGVWGVAAKYAAKSLSAEKTISVTIGTVAPITFPEPRVVADGVTIVSGKESFNRGDVATYTGALFSQSKPVANERVKVTVKTSTKTLLADTTAVTNENGEFRLKYVIATEAQPDTWTMTVTSEKDSTKTSEVSFKIV